MTPLQMPDAARRRLEDITRLRTVPLHEVRRARALLMAAEGTNNVEIARRCGVTPRTVAAWRRQFRDGGVEAVRWTRRGLVPPQELPADLVRVLIGADPQWDRHHRLTPAPAVVDGAQRFPWLVRIGEPPGVPPGVATEDPPVVEWRELAVAGLHLGEPPDAIAVALAVTAPGDPVGVHDDRRPHRSFLSFLKALALRRASGQDVHVVLNLQAPHLAAFEVDRWLSHPDRSHLHVHLLPCPALWRALAAHWLGSGCAAVAPSSVQRARQWREQEKP